MDHGKEEEQERKKLFFKCRLLSKTYAGNVETQLLDFERDWPETRITDKERYASNVETQLLDVARDWPETCIITDRERAEPAGVQKLREKLRKYSCSLTFDSNTVHRNLKLSDDGRKVTCMSKAQSYPDHPDRFDGLWPQLLCRDGLTGRCYWEVEWSGVVYISVSYRGISRRGYNDCMFGWSDQSWSLKCSDNNNSYSVWHNNEEQGVSSDIDPFTSESDSASNKVVYMDFPPGPWLTWHSRPSVSPSSASASSDSASSCSCSRVAVYVDCPAGILSFYRVSSGSLVHLHTFETTFSEPIYPGFGFWFPGSSVSFCQDLKPKLLDVQRESPCTSSQPDWFDDDSKLVEAPSSFRPEVETHNLQVSYRFQCPGPGVFQCALTALVFVVTQPAKLCYRIIQWDESILHPAGKTPAGPLYNISCSPVAVCGLHLPHCQTADTLASEGLLSVVHVSSDYGLNFLKPLKITDTHVVVRVSDLSAFGLVWDFIKRFMERKDPVPSQVLLYLGPLNSRAQNQKLYVFLLPRNIPTYEVTKDQKDCKFVRSTSNCKLIKDQSYVLTCPRASQHYKIQPQRAEFDLIFGTQYHPTFEIRLPINTEEVVITIKDEADTVVWEYDADLTDHSQDDVPSSVTVQSKSPNLHVDLLNILDELTEDEFSRFKWFLRNEPQSSRFRVRDSAARQEVVDHLLHQCSQEEVLQAVKRTFRKMGRNDLMEQL